MSTRTATLQFVFFACCVGCQQQPNESVPPGPVVAREYRFVDNEPQAELRSALTREGVGFHEKPDGSVVFVDPKDPRIRRVLGEVFAKYYTMYQRMAHNEKEARQIVDLLSARNIRATMRADGDGYIVSWAREDDKSASAVVDGFEAAQRQAFLESMQRR